MTDLLSQLEARLKVVARVDGWFDGATEFQCMHPRIQQSVLGLARDLAVTARILSEECTSDMQPAQFGQVELPPRASGGTQ